MLDTIDTGEVYLSGSGLQFKVNGKAKHGQDCTVPMVVYENIEPTYDYPTGQIWVMEESLFLKLFRPRE